MRPNQFYAGRVPVAASEPNYSGAEPARAHAVPIAHLFAALCLVVPTGFAFGPVALVIALIGSGAALMLAACLFAEGC